MKHLVAVTVLITMVFLVGCDQEITTSTASKLTAPSASAKTTPIGSKPGLLLIAHGAPWPKWNQPLLNLETKVNKALEKDNPFQAVKLVFMEFTEPSVADGIEAMEKAGCDRIIVVPLLIAPSSHSHWDIPALLGIYSDKEMEATLREEGAKLIRSKLPITITPTLAQGDLLETVMFRRVKALSKNPQEEAIVVMAHGDEGLNPIWDRRMRQIITYLCGKTGISYGDYAFVHVGQSYAQDGVSAVAAACDHKKRVLTVGCYVSMGTIGMHHRYMHTAGKGKIPMPNPLKGKDIALTKRGLLPDPAVVEWILKTAKDAL